jgi:iduronate 2-sulfatase
MMNNSSSNNSPSSSSSSILRLSSFLTTYLILSTLLLCNEIVLSATTTNNNPINIPIVPETINNTKAETANTDITSSSSSLTSPPAHQKKKKKRHFYHNNKKLHKPPPQNDDDSATTQSPSLPQFQCPTNQYLTTSSILCNKLFPPNPSLDQGTSVCASISIPNDPNKKCFSNSAVSFNNAANQCANYGMRLCQSTELNTGTSNVPYIRGQIPNCKLTSSATTPFVWTSTLCTNTNYPKKDARIGIVYSSKGDVVSSSCHVSTDPKQDPTAADTGGIICCSDWSSSDNNNNKCATCPDGTYTAPPTTRPTQVQTLEACSKSNKPLNILFIISDDLNTMSVGAYQEDSRPNTPNIDKFASQSIVFTNAHATMAMCTPSRSAFLTSLLPERTGVISIQDNMRGVIPDLVTLPQYFKSIGYHAFGVGKVFDGRSTGGSTKQDPASWSQPVWNPKGVDGKDELSRPGFCTSQLKIDPIAPNPPATTQCCAMDICTNDEFYTDGKLADRAIQFLNDQNDDSPPFFLALGFYRPHLPFDSPESYWMQWLREEFNHELAPRVPVGGCYGPALNLNEEPRSYSDWATLRDPTNPSENLRSRFLHGYFSAVSYMDTQFGRVLDVIKNNNDLNDRTMIIFIGDHGYHLGDHRMYGKKSVYDHATRTVLMVGGTSRVISPSLAGTRISQPVNLIDLYPTLLDVILGEHNDNLDGETFSLALRSPKQFDNDPSRLFSISQWPARGTQQIMSYTLRGQNWKYVAHIDGRSGNLDTKLVQDELYDMTGEGEAHNLVRDGGDAIKSFRNFFFKQVIVDRRFLQCRRNGVQNQVQHLVDQFFDGARP